jgi:5-carboxymethyl-2-hydroxymuconate isomerase
MPHITVEYSKNLEQSADVSELIKAVHKAAIGTKAFPVSAIRTRGASRKNFRVADGDPRNAFLAVVIRVAQGRTPELRHEIGSAIFESVTNHMRDVSAAIPLAITVELQEIDQTAAFRHSTIPANP